MKEATGELNMTVITVVAVAAVGLIFTLFVWPTIQSNLMTNTACSNLDANGNYEVTQTKGQSNKEGSVSCTSFTCTANYNGKTFTKNCDTTKDA